MTELKDEDDSMTPEERLAWLRERVSMGRVLSMHSNRISMRVSDTIAYTGNPNIDP